MKQSDIFGSAKWIAASVDALSGGMIIRKNFSLLGGERAKLYVIGLGTFVCYMNGKGLETIFSSPSIPNTKRAATPSARS